MSIPKQTLSNGKKIPVIGLGTYNLKGDKCISSIVSAINLGYRHIDTASYYKNERQVGTALKKSKINREEIFLTSKVWPSDLGYSQTKAAFNKSLKLLDTEYLDLFLIHWPGESSQLRIDAFTAMQELRDEGKIKSIGVSNFSIPQIHEIEYACGELPSINQVHFSPGNTDFDLLEHCSEENILLTAYTPINKGRAFSQNQEINSIEQKYGKNRIQITLRWLIQLGTIPIPKASKEDHLKQNIDIFDFELNDEDMDILKKIQ